MDPKEDFENVRQHKLERCGEETYFPKLASVLCCWEKIDIPVVDFMNNPDLQYWVGNEGIWGHYLWNHTGTANVSEISKNWDTIIGYLPEVEHITKNNSSIGPELTNLVLYNRNKETGIEFPLFIVANNHMLPLISGSILDGNHRMISLLYSLAKGDVQESSLVPVWFTYIPDSLVLGYNLLALIKLKIPIEKKLKLIEERILIGKNI